MKPIRRFAPFLLAAAVLASLDPAHAARADAPAAALPSLAPMIKRAAPAVVNIAVTAKVEIQNPLLQDPRFRPFFGDEPVEREMQAIGSGVIVDAAKGYVVTNNHVVNQADTIKVRLMDDRVFDAKLIGSDPDSDLAVLQIPAEKLTALPLGDAEKMEVGDYVVAIGNPFGLGQTVTSGIVSAVGRSGLGGRYEDFIQTDASINPGNSGGALVNLKGELVGINAASFNPQGSIAGNIGLGFAISTTLVKYALSEIIAHGSVTRGRIGIQGQQDLTPELAKAFGLPNTHGALIADVVKGSPADKAGLQAEDVILEANGHEIHDFTHLRNLIGLMKVGDKLDFKVWRDGKVRAISVVVGKDTDQANNASGLSLHPKLAGAVFAPTDESNSREGDAKGILVKTVQARSPAAKVGLKADDVILGVNRQRVTTMEDFGKLANADQKQLLLHVRRGKQVFFIVIQ